MKLLYLSLHPPLDTGQVATGIQVRVQGIRDVLEQSGMDIVQLSPADARPAMAAEEGVYYSAAGLADHLANNTYGAVIVAYWSLLEDLPPLAIPVVLDFIAPRLLEQMYEEGHDVVAQNQRLLSVLPQADHFLVGNQRQADLLLGLLLTAGFDCRHSQLLSIVPISARTNVSDGSISCDESAANPPGSPLKLVNAGVDWPWRDSSAYAAVLNDPQLFAGKVTYQELTGGYPRAESERGDEGEEGEEGVEGVEGVDSRKANEENIDGQSALLGYQSMQRVLQESHIGLELGSRNTEREFSHSFRALEYLQCGLPLFINPWIPLAGLVRDFDAGWIIEEPAEMTAVLQSILDNPAELTAKQAGVRRLVHERLNYTMSCQPLLDYLASPVKAAHFTELTKVAASDAVTVNNNSLAEASESATEQPAASTTTIILAALFKKFFCPKRPESTPDVLMVTRADLFPVDHGAAVKIIRTAESLSRQGRKVWLVTDSRRKYYEFDQGDMITHHFPWLVRLLCLPRFLAFMRLVKKGYPVSNSFLYLPVTDASYIVRAVYLTSRKAIGAYQAEFPAYVRPCRYARSLFGGKILLVQHNVEYERIKNQVADLTETNYQTLKNIEVAMCRLADEIVTVSENDRQKMISDGIAAEKIHTIPHGVDLQTFRDTTPINIKGHYGIPVKDKVLVYHGTYSYAPNLEAMEVMAREILPRLQQRGLDVTVLAIGSKPPDFPLHAKIHFAGSVDDLAEVIPAADLAVVTLQEGGGTRMKILDYFAAGVPVISTVKGIEGIPVTHGKEALIIDDFDAICDAIETLLSDGEKATALSTAAGEFVDSLSWDAIVRRYLPLLQ